VFLTYSLYWQPGYHETTSGEYRTPDGNVVRWTKTSSHYKWQSNLGWIIEEPERILLEGPKQELLTSDMDEVGHPNARLENYDSLQRARDQMRGLVRPRIPGGLYHVCDNPDCEYLDRDRVESTPLSRRYAPYAIEWYIRYLEKNPEDWRVLREFAISVGVLLDLDIAIDVVYSAYLNNPELGSDPFDPEWLGIDAMSFRGFLVKCVKHTHREPSAERWFMVAVLMQAEGRYDRASEMLDRAIELGLEESISDAFVVVSP
jgi:tetratricopeptide (TPR) repeat protein